ncbi:thrombospondin type-1 domain-containing protein 7A-like [Halichondria panicea]|uniref:thrombospondin type-1 domain-containing protein 7A-like n=1 Tax=Halichondria panicea TaxID=6063 RepID=UPI00312BC23D
MTQLLLACSIQMLLLCLPAMQTASTCPACGDYGIAMSEGVSLLCNNTTVEIVYSLSNYLTLALMCTSPDRNTIKEITIECESDRGHFSKTLNLTAEGILPGDECVARGCYEDDFYESYNLASYSCTIPRDCVWSEWGEWSECDGECGEGRQTRSRVVVTTSKGTGRDCSGLSSQNRTCNNNPCLEITAVPSPAATAYFPVTMGEHSPSTSSEWTVPVMAALFSALLLVLIIATTLILLLIVCCTTRTRRLGKVSFLRDASTVINNEAYVVKVKH